MSDQRGAAQKTCERLSPSHRTRLPTAMASRHEFSVWNIFKHFIGKDLTKITMPVILNEPLSFEQRLCEYLEYSYLLDVAAETEDPLERFEYVVAFTIASNAMSEARLQKPFNPVLGETYEYARFPADSTNVQTTNNGSQASSQTVSAESHDDSQDAESAQDDQSDASSISGEFHSASESEVPAHKESKANGKPIQNDVHASQKPSNESRFRGFRYVGEQVSHHPPISAFYAEQLVRAEDAEHGVLPGWTLTGAVEPKVKFLGKHFEIEPRGSSTLTLTRFNETYTWSNPNFAVHNILLGFGRIWIEIHGEPEVRCSTGWYARVHYEKASGGFFDTKPRADRLFRIDGAVFDSQGTRRSAIYGKWTETIYTVNPEEFDAYSNSHSSSPHSSTHRAHSTGDTNGELFDLHMTSQRRLWTVTPRVRDSSTYYNFTEFGMQLNDLEWPVWYSSVLPIYRRPSESTGPQSNNRNVLPPTDSRWRNDMRILENRGDLEAAAAEKHRIEEKQREARRHRNKKDYTPLWFRLNSDESESLSRHGHSRSHGHHSHGKRSITQAPNDLDWIFNHEYWQRDWSKCPDLF